MKTRLFQKTFTGILLTIGLFAFGAVSHAKPTVTITLNGNSDLKFTVPALVILAPALKEDVSMLAKQDQDNIKVWSRLTRVEQNPDGKTTKIVAEQAHSQHVPVNAYIDIQFSVAGKHILERINLDQSTQQELKAIGVTAQVEKKGSGADVEYLVKMKEK